MTKNKLNSSGKKAFGTYKFSLIDKFGVWLSHRTINKHIKGRDNLHVLELGCGFMARNLFAIEKKCKKMVGVDFNISNQLNSNPKFTPIEASIDNALENLDGKRFDIIMIISVLEHLENPTAVLEICKKLLNPNGILLINVPTWLGKFFLEFSAFRIGLSPKEEMDDHKMYYNKRDLWPILVKSGFLPSMIKMNYHKFQLNLFASVKKGEV